MTVKVVVAKTPLVLPVPPMLCWPVCVLVGIVAGTLKEPLPSVVGVASTVVLVQAGWPQLYVLQRHALRGAIARAHQRHRCPRRPAAGQHLQVRFEREGGV